MSDYLMHHGKKGMHWYDRKYQNSDGSLTPLGRIHYGVGKARSAGKAVANTVRNTAGKIQNAKEKSRQRKANKTVAKLEKEKEKAQIKAKEKQLKQEIKAIKHPKRESNSFIEQLAKDSAKKAANQLIDKGTTALIDTVKKQALKNLGIEEKKDKYKEAEKEAKFWANKKSAESIRPQVIKGMFKRGMTRDEISKELNVDSETVHDVLGDAKYGASKHASEGKAARHEGKPKNKKKS